MFSELFLHVILKCKICWNKCLRSTPNQKTSVWASLASETGVKCKQCRESDRGGRPSPLSPWFRHKAPGSVLISDLESSPVNKSDNWGGCQPNWIVALSRRPCAEWTRLFYNDVHVSSASVQVIICGLLIWAEYYHLKKLFTFLTLVEIFVTETSLIFIYISDGMRMNHLWERSFFAELFL